ncbi:MAG: alpha/beta fold hydrolase [Acidobacteria bacterium]|nr:alpha/beta fold hydrolase [Acidobacteriota bacterium]
MSVQLETVSIHGHEVALRRGGTGPALVLVHGMAGSAETWHPIIDRLAENYTVIAPDLPGHGQSDKPRGDYSLGAYSSFLRDLMTQLDCPSATIVGQSLGGGIAMQFAYQHPEFCERLVLVSSGGLGEEVSWMLRLIATPGVEYVLPIAFMPWIGDGIRHVTPVLSKLGLRPSAQLKEIWRAYDSLADPEARSAFVHTMKAVIDTRGQRVSAVDRLYLAEDVPTLIVWGGRDPIIPVSHGRTAHELIPRSRLEIFDKSGHFPHCEEPQRFVELLEDFTTSTVSARPNPAGATAQ